MIRNTTAAPFYFSFMLVPDIGIEPMTYRLSSDYSTAELIRCNLFLVPPVRIELTSTDFQSAAMTTLAQVVWGEVWESNP